VVIRSAASPPCRRLRTNDDLRRADQVPRRDIQAIDLDAMKRDRAEEG
jgi:hypothetical protein